MGLINCPACGQKQSDENMECINCGNLLKTPNPTPNMKSGEISCPHCGHMQGRAEQCENCGKSMRTVLKVRKSDIVGTLISAGVTVLGIWFALNAEVSIGVLITVLGFFFTIMGCVAIHHSFENAGLLLDHVTAERLYRESLPQTFLSGLKGVPGIAGRSTWIMLDRERGQLIFTEDEIERFLPFAQIGSYGVVTRKEHVKGNVLSGAAIGGVIGGHTGAIVGAMAAKEGTSLYNKYFVINGLSRSGAQLYIECPYKGFNQSKIDQLAKDFEEAIGVDKCIHKNPPTINKSEYL